MAKKINAVVGTRLPSAIIDFINSDIENGEYASASDWVREACRRFYNERKKLVDGLGGGAPRGLGAKIGGLPRMKRPEGPQRGRRIGDLCLILWMKTPRGPEGPHRCENVPAGRGAEVGPP